MFDITDICNTYRYLHSNTRDENLGKVEFDCFESPFDFKLNDCNIRFWGKVFSRDIYV